MKKPILIILLTILYTTDVFCVGDKPTSSLATQDSSNISEICETVTTKTPTTLTSKNELVPNGIFIPEKLHRCSSSDHSYYGESLPNKFRTFNVTSYYETLPEGGVKFNIEDVTPALAEDLNMQKISQIEHEKNEVAEVNNFYKQLNNKSNKRSLKDIEVFSETPTDLVYSGSDGILAACVIAFSRHLPLTLKPDHIWMLILHAVCENINQNSEELRYKIVSHEGKKEIIINAPSLIQGSTPASVWEREVFPKFATEIRNNLNSEELHDLITADFSVTNSTERSCKEIMLMGATAKYFDFTFRTLCGIPNIKLLGSREDWQAIIDRTEALFEYITPEFKQFWQPKLKPVLENFVAAFDGNINYSFWQTMVKLRYTGGGSGSYAFLSGWIQILFPYLKNNNLNKNMKSWHEAYFIGPEASKFPSIMTSVPVVWQYYNNSFKMHYHAGIVGFSQNPQDGSLMPVEGWRISYDQQHQKD